MGLSKTSTSIGWVLVDGRDAAADPLDHDAFDITEASGSSPAATARRVRDIATASGYTVDSVHVTSSGNVSALRDALTECGFDDVVSVPLTEATRSWARDTGYANALEKTAICVLGQDSAALSMIDTRSGAITSTTTTVTGDLAIFTNWLNFAMGADETPPEVLYLVGSRPKLDDVAGRLDKALCVPVVATHDAQIALARGAASSNGKRIHVAACERTGLAVRARALTVVAAVAVVSVLTLSSAASSIPLPESNAAQTAAPPESPPPAAIVQDPVTDVPVAPMVFPPPAAALPQPVPEQIPPARAPVAVTPDAVVPEAIPLVTPPVEHLPDPLPVQHLPQSPTAPGPGPDPAAPELP
jgi:hypothetical protein